MTNAKFIFVLFILLISRAGVGIAQDCGTPLIIAEFTKMVDLDETQHDKLEHLYSKYIVVMDSAIYKIEDRKESAQAIYNCKQAFNTNLLNILSDEQKREYIRNYATPEVSEKAKAKVNILSKSGKYSQDELDKSFNEIFEYLMLEKIVYATQRYNIEKQKENIAQLKKLEPQSLKAANTFQKIKHQGKRYQDGFQW